MAFNPFVSFRKYQKFWMASLVLMSMMTFVLCTGLGQGGLEDRLLRIFGGRTGAALARLNGRDIHSEELHNIKTQRDIANDFMRKFCNYLVEDANKKFQQKEEKNVDEKVRQQMLQQATFIKFELGERLKKARYFGTGTKLEDLVDFKLWISEADRLGVYLEPESVQYLVGEELLQRITKFTSGDSRLVMNEVRRNYTNASDQYIINALRDEFRVRIAQLAVLTYQQDRMSRFASAHDQKQKDLRVPVSPAQLWDFFKENRAEYDLTVVPIEAQTFLTKVENPSDTELNTLFDQHRKDPYDPTSEKPGFGIPQRIKVEWVTADPNAPAYKNGAKLLTLLETYPPAIFNPTLQPLLNWIRYGVAPAAEKAAYQVRYEREAGGFLSPYRSVPLTGTGFLGAMVDYQALENPTALIALVAGLAQTDGMFAAPVAMRNVVYQRQENQLRDLAMVEVKKRAPVFGTCVGIGAQGSLLVAAPWYAASLTDEYLPLDIVLPKFRDRYEKSLAHSLVAKTMVRLRNALEDPSIQGKGPAVENRLAVMAQVLGKDAFQRHTSQEFYNRFTLQQSKELDPLRQSYLKYYVHVNLFEARGGTEKNLRDTDFDKLFFDKGENFSAAQGKFVVRSWPPSPTVKPMPLAPNPEDYKDAPPDVARQVLTKMAQVAQNPHLPAPTIDLYKEAEKPILFWKVAEEPSAIPTELSQVRDRVEKAWKILRAREKFAIPAAGAVAESLAKASNPETLSLTEAKKLGHERILLRRVAPLFVVSGDEVFARKYATYQIPKDTFLYPRSDMAAELMTFANPQKPVQIADPVTPLPVDKELDKLNKKLFDDFQSSKKDQTGRRLVQVLTNKPRTVFYVAAIVDAPRADPRDFEEAYRRTVGHMADTFIQRAFDSISATAEKTLIQQLRENHHWWVTPETEQRKSFDTDTTS